MPVHVVGWGMSPEDLTPRSREIVRKAQVLVGGRRLLELFPGAPGPEDRPGKRPGSHPGATSRPGRGSPGGGAGLRRPQFLRRWAAGGQGPGGRAGGAAPQYHRGPGRLRPPEDSWQDAIVVSLHGRTLGNLEAALDRGAEKMMIYTDPEHTPAAIARYLLDRGQGGARLCVLEDLGQASETPHLAQPGGGPGAGVFALESGGGPARPGKAGKRQSHRPAARPLHLGLPEEALAHQAGLITKARGAGRGPGATGAVHPA